MRLLSEPKRPNWSLAVVLAAGPRYFVEWEPFLPQTTTGIAQAV
jgi:energy-coupling factor transporter ATP-binding protein EcfA2